MYLKIFCAEPDKDPFKDEYFSNYWASKRIWGEYKAPTVYHLNIDNTHHSFNGKIKLDRGHYFPDWVIKQYGGREKLLRILRAIDVFKFHPRYQFSGRETDFYFKHTGPQNNIEVCLYDPPQNQLHQFVVRDQFDQPFYLHYQEFNGPSEYRGEKWLNHNATHLHPKWIHDLFKTDGHEYRLKQKLRYLELPGCVKYFDNKKVTPAYSMADRDREIDYFHRMNYSMSADMSRQINNNSNIVLSTPHTAGYYNASCQYHRRNYSGESG